MNPKPIKVKGCKPPVEIQIKGYKNKTWQPYLYITGGSVNGFIEDRDVKRLLKWCQDCLTPRKIRK